MKTDLATAVVTSIVGFFIAFFVTGLLTGEIQPFSYKTVDASISADLVDPDPEVFNYRALNPTVEVFIGSCIEYDSNGECVEILTEEESGDESSEVDQENF